MWNPGICVAAQLRSKDIGSSSRFPLNPCTFTAVVLVGIHFTSFRRPHNDGQLMFLIQTIERPGTRSSVTISTTSSEFLRPINCKIVHVLLSDGLSYETISYVWGAPKFSKPILLVLERLYIQKTSRVYFGIFKKHISQNPIELFARNYAALEIIQVSTTTFHHYLIDPYYRQRSTSTSDLKSDTVIDLW